MDGWMCRGSSFHEEIEDNYTLIRANCIVFVDIVYWLTTSTNEEEEETTTNTNAMVRFVLRERRRQN